MYWQGVEDDILTWLNMLRKSGVTPDWIIIVMETPENRNMEQIPPQGYCAGGQA
jgi:hypothetical protein